MTDKLTFTALALEQFIPNSFNLTYDCFVGPCSGFKHLGIIHNYNFVEDSTIILYSENDAQIHWANLLLEEWSGNLYQLWGLVRDYTNDTTYTLSFPPIMDNNQINSVYLDQIYSEYGLDMELLMEQWQRMKKFKWLILKNSDSLIELINHDSYKGVYIFDDSNQFASTIDQINVPVVLETKSGITLYK